MNSILSDTTKFEIVNRDPVKNLKVEVNNIIKSINRECKKRVLEPLKGEFSLGYLYGTVKNHKANNPLRPIISQIHTLTHSVAKQINKIITPYLPTKYMLSSTDDFLAILRDTNPEGLICSLDVESFCLVTYRSLIQSRRSATFGYFFFIIEPRGLKFGMRM